MSKSNIISIICSIAASILAKKKVAIVKNKIKETTLKDTNDVDFTNITHNWEKSKLLFDILKKKCHPDRFEKDKAQKATQIFQQVIKNKYNYSELLKIKEEAIKILKIEI